MTIRLRIRNRGLDRRDLRRDGGDVRDLQTRSGRPRHRPGNRRQSVRAPVPSRRGAGDRLRSARHRQGATGQPSGRGFAPQHLPHPRRSPDRDLGELTTHLRAPDRDHGHARAGDRPLGSRKTSIAAGTTKCSTSSWRSGSCSTTSTTSWSGSTQPGSWLGRSMTSATSSPTRTTRPVRPSLRRRMWIPAVCGRGSCPEWGRRRAGRPMRGDRPGADNDAIYGEELGLSEAERQRLAELGVI